MDESTEGAEFTAYFDSHGPRFLLAEYLGETGKVEYRFRMVDSTQYIVDRVESDYNAPITDSTFNGVARSTGGRLYVCGGKVEGQGDAEFLGRASEVLERAFEYLNQGY